MGPMGPALGRPSEAATTRHKLRRWHSGPQHAKQHGDRAYIDCLWPRTSPRLLISPFSGLPFHAVNVTHRSISGHS
jgi:hypothetical protein